MRRFTLGLAWCFACCSLAAQGAEEPAQVGDLGRPAAIVVTGGEAFAADEIVRGLFADVDVRNAAHRDAPLDKFLQTLAEQTLTGYRYAGHLGAQAEAVVRADKSQIELTIREGVHHRYGEIQITGAKAVSVETLRRCLTERRRDEKAARLDPDGRDGDPPVWKTSGGFTAKTRDPLWIPGEPASLTYPKMDRIRAALLQAYRDAGLLSTEVGLDSKLEGESVHLVVLVKEDSPATISEIEIRGNEKNSRDEVIQYLDLKTGRTFDRREQTRIERRLWKSARFCDYSVEFEPLGKWPGAGTLIVKLTEFKPAPKLTEDFSDVEAALLRTREWLTHFAEQGDELVVTIETEAGAKWEFVAASAGLVGYGEVPHADKQAKPRRYTFHCTDERVVLAAIDRGQKCDFRASDYGIMIYNGIRVQNDEKIPTWMNLGAGFVTNSNRRRTITLDRSLPPAVLPALAHGDNDEFRIQCELADGALTIKQDFVHAEVDADTGRLRELIMTDDANFTVRVTVARGRFAEMQKQVQSLTDECRDTFDPEAPLASLAGFIVAEDCSNLFEGPELNIGLEKVVQVIRKALAADLLSPIREFRAATESRPGEFFIPTNDYWRATFEDGPDRWLAAACYALPALADQLFPPDSWAWLLMKEAGMASTGRKQYVASELNRGAADGRWGPLACWCTSLAAPWLNIDGLESPAAARGLNVLTVDDFRRDCEALLDVKYGSGRICRNLGVFVRSLDGFEALILTGLATEYVPWIEPLFTSLRADADQPLEEAFAVGLQNCWKASLRQQIAERFHTLRK